MNKSFHKPPDSSLKRSMEQRTEVPSLHISSTDKSHVTIKIGYTVTHGWEHTTTLTKQQLSILAFLTTSCGRDNNLKKCNKNRTNLGHDTLNAPLDPQLSSSERHALLDNPVTVVHDAQNFHAWYSTIDATLAHEADERYRSYAYKLTKLCSSCDCLLTKIYDGCRSVSIVVAIHDGIEKRGETLRNDCQRLMREIEYLCQFAKAIMSKLVFFDEIDNVTGSLSESNLLVDTSTLDKSSLVDFIHLLEHLDSCIEFIGEHQQYAGGNNYSLKLQQLRSRALASIRFRFIALLNEINISISKSCMKVQQGQGVQNSEVLHKKVIKEIETWFETSEEHVVTSIFYVKYATFSQDLKFLIGEIEKRTQKAEYKLLMKDCHNLYCEERSRLLSGAVRLKMHEIVVKAAQDVQSLTRTGITYLMDLAMAEIRLFKQLFAMNQRSDALVPLMNSFGGLIYDVLRPIYIHIGNVHELAKLAEIIKGEILEGILADDEETLLTLSPILYQMLADIQERMIYRAQTFLRDEVGNYIPSSMDIDYPKKLMFCNNLTKNNSLNLSSQSALWYPPLEKTLKCLSSLYRCIESTTFSGLAQEAISLCTDNIILASKIISRTSGASDGQLFLIKHLLILREQIAPFDAEYTIEVKELDFSHMRGHMQRIFAGELSLFALSQDNAFFVLASEGRPHVLESTVNSKKELEKKLKIGCEAFIMTVTKSTVEPMLRFITKVTAFEFSEGDGKKLSTSAFGSEKRVAEVICSVNSSLETSFIDMMNSLKIYIRGTETQALLLKPIFSNIVEAHVQFFNILLQVYPREVLKGYGMLEVDELNKLFQGMLL